MKNLAEFKRRCVPGALLEIEHFITPGIKRVRVIANKTKDLECQREDGKPSYLSWGRAAEWEFSQDAATRFGFKQGERFKVMTVRFVVEETTPERVPSGHENNLQTIIKAAKNDDLILIHVRQKSGNYVTVLAATNRVGNNIDIVPLAKLFDGNPYEELEPPN